MLLPEEVEEVRKIVLEAIVAIAEPGTVVLLRGTTDKWITDFLREHRIAVIAGCEEKVVGVLKG